MNASTSERVGVPAEPPSRVHLMAATAAPRIGSARLTVALKL
jgi:hypothetical protein